MVYFAGLAFINGWLSGGDMGIIIPFIASTVEGVWRFYD